LRKQHEDSMNDLSKQEESKAELYETMGAEIAEVMLPLDQSSISEWILETSFISAKGLKKADRFGKSDPYVTVYVNGISVGSSKTIKKTLQPEWNQTKQLLVHRKKHFQKANKTRWQDSEVIFEVYDHDLVGTDDPLGRIVLNGEGMKDD
jgi:Ca2+-dependent lipid-binding protein